METINGYELVSDEMATSSAVSWKAKKDGQYFFLKKFRDPARPRDAIRVHNPAEFKRRSDWCDRFEDSRKTINALISNLGGGNFVAPVEFFLHKNKYFQATPWRQIEKKTINEITRLSDAEKLLILKTAANCVKLLHDRGIIHCDIKPDNLPVTLTASNKMTCSLIDFDTAVLESKIPCPDEIYGTDPYLSPELMSYKMGRNYYPGHKFTVKNDVFAMAMIFHWYWSGEEFSFPKPQKGPYLHHAVLEDLPITMSDSIPVWLKTILLKMIHKQPESRPSMGEILEYLGQVDLQQTTTQKRAAPAPEKKDEPTKVQTAGYSKGAKFPEDAMSFEILPNNKVKLIYNDGSKMALSIDVAVNKRYITKNNGG